MAKKENSNKNKTTQQLPASQIICLLCGKNGKETKFYKARNPKYQFFGKIPWCFSCIKDKYDEFYKKYEDSKKSMYELCRFLDIPFVLNIYEIAKSRWQESGVELFQGYITYYSSVGWKKAGITFMDSDKIENLDKPDNDYTSEDVDKELIFKWGEGFSPSDYIYLENELAECEKTLKCDTWAESTLLREICIKKLEVRNRRKQGSDTKDVLKELQELMKTCAIDPAKTMTNSSKSLDTFGEWIKDIEQYSPAEWFKDKKKYKDMDGLDDYLKKYITRPIKNFITGSRDFNVDKEIMIDFDKEGKE